MGDRSTYRTSTAENKPPPRFPNGSHLPVSGHLSIELGAPYSAFGVVSILVYKTKKKL